MQADNNHASIHNIECSARLKKVHVIRKYARLVAIQLYTPAALL